MRKGIWGFALVAIVLLMASCSSKSEYANAIPKDAAMVMSFDFKTMAEKSGINGKGGEKVVAKLTDALKSGLEGEAYKTAEKIIQNPSESGLSFTDKVYMFITPHSNAFALLAKVDDEGKVEDLLSPSASMYIRFRSSIPYISAHSSKPPANLPLSLHHSPF